MGIFNHHQLLSHRALPNNSEKIVKWLHIKLKCLGYIFTGSVSFKTRVAIAVNTASAADACFVLSLAHLAISPLYCINTGKKPTNDFDRTVTFKQNPSCHVTHKVIGSDLFTVKSFNTHYMCEGFKLNVGHYAIVFCLRYAQSFGCHVWVLFFLLPHT